MDGADELSAVLESLRLRGQMYCRLEGRAPWAMRAPSSPVATFHGLVRGDAVLQIAGEEDVPLTSGDLALVCHGSGHAIGDVAGRPALPIAEVLASAGPTRLVRCGGRGARTTVVCGGFTVEREGPPLLALMPTVMHVRGNALVARLLGLLADEAQTSGRSPGSAAFIARLTEALFVEVVRAWIAATEGERGARVAALRDVRIASTLAAIHREPSRDWTVLRLARGVGMSRSAFALTFAQLVGLSPLAYVKRWRLYAAKVLLRESDDGIAQIAARVGYDSEASLGKAFKLHFGISPGSFRSSSRDPGRVPRPRRSLRAAKPRFARITRDSPDSP